MDKETRRVMERTGLTREAADAYWCFYKHADWSGESGLILYGDVKFELERLVDDEGITSDERQNLVQKLYDYWLDFFRRKGLIAEKEILYNVDTDLACSYPVLVGYQPFNDPEIYIAYKKKGEKEWSGRMSAELLTTEGKRMRERGYEFRV